MAYGVVLNLDEKSGEFDYFCGVEVATISPAHKSLATYKVATAEIRDLLSSRKRFAAARRDRGHIRYVAADFGPNSGSSDANFTESC